MKINLEDFEKVRKKTSRALGEGEMSVARTAMSFHSSLVEEFGNFVEIYLNRKDNLVLFRKADNLITGFKIGKRKGCINHSVQATEFLRQLKTGIYKTKKVNEGRVIEGALILNKQKEVKE